MSHKLFEDKAFCAEQILKIIEPKYKNVQEMNPKSLQDIVWTIEYLNIAYEFANIDIFLSYLDWLARLFEGIGLSPENVPLLYSSLLTFLDREQDEELLAFLNQKPYLLGIANNNVGLDTPYQEQTEKYLSMMLKLQKEEAKNYIHQLFESGMDLEEIYVKVLQPAMHEVGNLWHQNKISVAKEHYCTVITQYIMTTFYDDIFANIGNGRKLLSCTIGSELHELGIRMVSDIFEKNGWESKYLGANVPVEDLIDFAEDYHPDIIALSVTMPYHVSLIKETIRIIREKEKLKDVMIFVGGKPFNENQDLYKKVGADVYAKDAITSLNKARDIFG